MYVPFVLLIGIRIMQKQKHGLVQTLRHYIISAFCCSIIYFEYEFQLFVRKILKLLTLLFISQTSRNLHFGPLITQTLRTAL